MEPMRFGIVGCGGIAQIHAQSMETLANEGLGRLVAGAETDACIRTTLHGALVRGYDTILVSDAHTTIDKTPWGAPSPDQVIAHTNLYWKYQTAPGREAGTVETTEVDFYRLVGL